MLGNFQTVSFLLILGLLIYWAIPSSKILGRSLVLIVLSLLTLAVLSLEALLLAILLSVVALFLLSFQLSSKRAQKIWVSTLIFIPLIGFSIIQQGGLFKDLVATSITIGLSYYSLKLYSLIRDCIKQELFPSISDVCVYIFFFPVFSVGPIENIDSLNRQATNVSFDIDEFFYGLYRLFLGLFKVLYLADQLLHPLLQNYLDTSELTTSSAWISAYIYLIFLYFNFSGFSDLAIGVSRLFGVRIRENFNHPYKARNIQEFWQRWHMSLGNWVSKYIFFPLVRNTGKPALSVLVVFLLMGLWHKFSVNYIIWGVAHGGCMALVREASRSLSRMSSYNWLSSSRFYRTLTGFVTLSFVAVLSRFANFESLSEGLVFISKLL